MNDSSKAGIPGRGEQRRMLHIEQITAVALVSLPLTTLRLSALCMIGHATARDVLRRLVKRRVLAVRLETSDKHRPLKIYERGPAFVPGDAAAAAAALAALHVKAESRGPRQTRAVAAGGVRASVTPPPYRRGFRWMGA